MVTGLAFLTGWADVSLVTKYRTFATMMTGNTMWMANALTQAKLGQVLYYATAITAYMLGVGLFRTWQQKETPRSRRIGLLVTSLFVASDLIFAATNTRFFPIALLATGFGLINSLGPLEAGTLTFVVTGHMIKLSNLYVDRKQSSETTKFTKDERVAIIENTSIIGSFFVGAVFAWILQLKKELLQKTGNFAVMGICYGLVLSGWNENILQRVWRKKTNRLVDVSSDESIPEDSQIEASSIAHSNT